MNIVNPFHVNEFKNFGEIYLVVIGSAIVLVYLIIWISKITARNQLNIFMYITPMLMCWLVAIFYWYLAIIVCLLLWLAVTWGYKLELKIVIQDELEGITAATNNRISEQKAQWSNKSEYQKMIYLDNYNKSIKRVINLKLLFIISFLTPIVMILIFDLCGYHYYF